RHSELSYVRRILEQRNRALLTERTLILESFEDESDDIQRYRILGPVRPWIFTRREWHHVRMQEYEQDYQALREKERRLANHIRGIQALRGVDIIACALVWNDGYPLGGRSPLTRFLDRGLMIEDRGSKIANSASIRNSRSAIRDPRSAILW